MKYEEIDYSVKSQRKTSSPKKKKNPVFEEGLRPQHQPYKKPKTHFKNYIEQFDEDNDDYFQ